MAGALRILWARHRGAVLLLAALIVLTGFFLVRLTVSTIHWSDPQNRDPVIEGWMPLRYVARAWDVPPEVIRAAIDPPPGKRPTVEDVARSRNTDVDAIRAELMDAIAAWRAEQDGE